jgi:hypothetical protein
MADGNIVTVNFKGKEYKFILNPKTFSTGSQGFFANGKIVITQEERYQIQIQLVLIGSKNK